MKKLIRWFRIWKYKSDFAKLSKTDKAAMRHLKKDPASKIARGDFG